MLSKTLTVYKALRQSKADVDDELVTAKGLNVKESAYNQELLKAVTMLVSSEKRDKGFFKKLAEQLGKVLKAATNPENMATIVTLIVLAKKLQ